MGANLVGDVRTPDHTDDMSLLAFMCTDRDSSWDPFCNGDDLAVLVGIGLVLAAGATVGLGRGRSPGVIVAIGMAATLISLVLTLWIGFALA